MQKMQTLTHNIHKGGWYLLSRGYLVLLIFFLNVPAWAEVMVDSFEGVSGDFSVKSGTTEQPISMGMSLKAGDEIKLLKNSKDTYNRHFDKPNSVKLWIGNDVVTITEFPPYRVPKSADPPSWVVELWRNSVTTVKTMFDYAETVVKSAYSSGSQGNGRTEIPILNGTPYLVGGKDFWIAWKGSNPGHKVKVSPLSSENALSPRVVDGCGEKMEITETKLSFTKELQPGEYTVEVTNEKGDSLTTGKFKVVATTSKPKPPFDEAVVRKQSPHLLAAWWDSQENGKWRLQAYQEVAGKQDYSSCVVRLGLASGR